MSLGAGLGLLGGLVAPLMEATGLGSSGQEKYKRFLKSRGISASDAQRMLSQEAGLLADKTDLAKQGLMGQMQAQGLGSSIIGAQAGLQADVAKNKSIVDRQRAIIDQRMKQKMLNAQELADFELTQSGVRRQGISDLLGGALGGLSKYGGMKGGKGALFDWLNK
jgi:uncharacterized protein YfiM (DUF2279 family)